MHASPRQRRHDAVAAPMTRDTFVRRLPGPTTAVAVATLLPGCRLEGHPERPIAGVGSLASTSEHVLAFCDATDAAERLAATRASVIIVPSSAAVAPRADQTLLVVDDVRAAFIDAVGVLLPGSERPPDPAPGVDPAARIDTSARVAG